MIDVERCLSLLNSDGLGESDAVACLAPIGFDDPPAALRRLRSLADQPADRSALSVTLPSLLFALSEAATPDASLTNFERLAQASPDRAELFRYLHDHPRAVEILVRLFVGSQFLTEILIRNPAYLERLTQHKRLAEFKSRGELYDQGRAAAEEHPDYLGRLNALRRFQQWELLRLAACDSFGLMDLKTVTLQLALLADSLIQNCLVIVADDAGVDAADFAVLGFGKLGGEELNYSSDIDLVFVCEHGSERYWGLGQKLIKAIAEPTGDGFLYRVDMRLRPWGSSGALVTTSDAYVSYLQSHGRLWEKQALLKARVIAGNFEVGAALLKRLEPIIFNITPDEARANVLDMKQRIEAGFEKAGREWGQVKGGQGSIRDVEFVTQYLQLVHGRDVPGVRSPNTLDALVRLADLNILQADEFRQLSSGYVVLRTIEHALQLTHNKQTHALPDNPRELAYLAGRLDFPGPAEFVQHYEQHCRAIRRIYERHILQTADEAGIPESRTRTVASHLGDAAASYEELFSPEASQRHLVLLEQLTPESLVQTDVRPLGDDRWELTIVGYDQIGDLSLMCGLLFVFGFDIESGFVFTGAEVAEQQQRPAEASPRRGPAPSPRRRKYVNVFHVRTPRNATAEDWERYEGELRELLQLADRNRQREAQGRLAKRVASAIRNRRGPARLLLPVEIDVDNASREDVTVLHIRAEDTTGFLYEFTNALAVSSISIQRVWIESEGTQVVDTLWVVDAQGRKIVEPQRLNELRAAAVLIKHFTHLLPSSSNPESALLHFREFLEALFQRPGWVQDLALLQNSEVLDALARLLGVSDFLWHDFLRLQHSNLFPVVADVQGLQKPKSRAALAAELSAELEAASTPDERRERLNAFKDREMLRVDMRHILGLQDKFGMFSQELTDVAEVVVDAAYRLCRDELAAVHGKPRLEGDGPCGLCVCALGKCGGQELGFASDIELMFVYEGDGSTTGPDVVSNLEFFQKLVDRFRKAIHARRQGIFEVDLRLRPYGKAGSLAVSLETFEKYFGHDGPAWPFERQALVKLRPIAGDEHFGSTIVAARDRICYSGRPFDVSAMRGMREKQLRQLVRAGTLNAKLSPGGLVDCEYLVQALQITYGDRYPELRSTNTRAVLRGLEATGILSPDDRIHLRDAYRFLRRLIDGLRMVRGDARDLTVPPQDSEEFEFLARRLEYGDRAAEFAEDIERHTRTVREFSRLLDQLPTAASA